MHEKVFKCKDHAMSVSADPFDHTDIQYIQCFSFSLEHGVPFPASQYGALEEKRLL